MCQYGCLRIFYLSVIYRLCCYQKAHIQSVFVNVHDSQCVMRQQHINDFVDRIIRECRQVKRHLKLSMHLIVLLELSLLLYLPANAISFYVQITKQINDVTMNLLTNHCIDLNGISFNRWKFLIIGNIYPLL